MKLNEHQIRELEEASKPLIKWMNENCHPHAKVIVETTGAELVEGIARIKNLEFVKD